MKKKILVVEDNVEENYDSIELLLNEGHEVYGARNFGEAVDKLNIGTYHHHGTSDIDVLLTDLFFPYGTEHNDAFHAPRFGKHGQISEPEPLGFPLVLAAVRSGVKYIGMITSSNHHDGPISATLDYFAYGEPFKILGTRFMTWESRNLGLEQAVKYDDGRIERIDGKYEINCNQLDEEDKSRYTTVPEVTPFFEYYSGNRDLGTLERHALPGNYRLLKGKAWSKAFNELIGLDE